MKVKFHKNCENAGKVLKTLYKRCNFVKFDIHGVITNPTNDELHL